MFELLVQDFENVVDFSQGLELIDYIFISLFGLGLIISVNFKLTSLVINLENKHKEQQQNA